MSKKLLSILAILMMAITSNAQTLNLTILDELENDDDYEWGYQLYDGDVSIAEGTYVQINIGTWHTEVMNIYMNDEVVYTKPSGSLYNDDVYHFTAGTNCKILGGANMFDWYGNLNVYITQDASVAVTGVTLSQTSASLTAGGAALELTPTVAPEGATDKTVKWSVVQEGSIVALYTDQACTQAVGTAAIDPAKVYVKPLAAGQATVTVTTNDGAMTATCTVSVAPAVPQQYTLDSVPLDWQVKVGAATPVSPTAYTEGNTALGHVDNINETDSVELIPPAELRGTIKAVRLTESVAAPQLQTVHIGGGLDVTLYYMPGDTWADAIARPENSASGFSIDHHEIYCNGWWIVIGDYDDFFYADAPVDPNLDYRGAGV